jgi:hypothetical protein
LFRSRSLFLFQTLQPPANARHSRFKFGLFQQPVFIGIDQSADAALDGADLLVELIVVDIGVTHHWTEVDLAGNGGSFPVVT